MSKFVHTPEQAAEWANYRDRWIDIALRTDPMTDEEKDLCRDAVNDLYKMVRKANPQVVFVDSPLMAEMVAACSARLLFENNDATIAATRAATSAATRDATSAATMDATYTATYDATSAATWDATGAATRAATSAATWDATIAATRDATRAATRDATMSAAIAATWAATMDATYTATRAATDAATRAATYAATYAATMDATYTATWDATDAATRAATYAATYAATRDATRAATSADLNWYVIPYAIKDICLNIAGPKALEDLKSIKSLLQGGNQWAYAHAFYEWFRHVAKLDINWSKWIPWNTLGEHSGPRYVHEKFVIISDFPTILKVDNENRPHSSTGPFCQWRDGFSLYAWHGVRVPAWIIERPDLITMEKIDGESNAEIRRVMLDRYGFLRYLQEKQAQVIDQDFDEGGEVMKLYSMPTDDDEGNPMFCLYLRNSTQDPSGSVREYVLRVPPFCKNVWEARNWTFDLSVDSKFSSVS